LGGGSDRQGGQKVTGSRGVAPSPRSNGPPAPTNGGRAIPTGRLLRKTNGVEGIRRRCPEGPSRARLGKKSAGKGASLALAEEKRCPCSRRGFSLNVTKPWGYGSPRVWIRLDDRRNTTKPPRKKKREEVLGGGGGSPFPTAFWKKKLIMGKGEGTFFSVSLGKRNRVEGPNERGQKKKRRLIHVGGENPWEKSSPTPPET